MMQINTHSQEYRTHSERPYSSVNNQQGRSQQKEINSQLITDRAQ